MKPIEVKRIAHIVLYVRDPEASAAWYAKVLGMEISARVQDGPYKGGIFMTFGVSDHDIALFPAPEGATQGREFEHVGLDLVSESIDDLRRAYAHLLENDVRIAEILDHGVSTGIYFYDPDGHMLEVMHQSTAHDDGKAIQQLRENGGQANPTPLDPLHG
jgi:catechol 2,3-dioxygenase-like lactoylglutathione lyase family enzyme